MNSRERFFAALKGEPCDRVPVFPLLMFFAISRAGITYRRYAGNGEALAAAQLAVLDRFDVDALTVCSDAFRIAGALGGEMVFPEDKPPYIAEPVVKSAGDVAKLGRVDPTDRSNRMGDRVWAAECLAKGTAGRAATLGWVDMPFAEACSVCGVTNFMLMLMDDPATAHKLLDKLTEMVIDFSLAQLEVGVDMIGAGDAAASLVSADQYEEFALPYERRVCEAIRGAGGLTKLHICGNTAHLLDKMAGCGADLFNVDHMVPLEAARDAYAAVGCCYKGNLDPVEHLMRETPEGCTKRAHECIRIAEGTAYMLSPGCEVPAETPDEVFRAFCDAPKSYPSG